MNLELPGRVRQWNGPALLAALRPILEQGRQDSSLKTRLGFFILASLVGAVLGILVIYVPPLYLFFILGGVLFGILLLFKVEVAVLLAILIRNWLGQFNYLGNDTPMHPNGLMGVAIIGGAAVFFLLNRIDFSRLRAFWPFLTFAALYLVSIVRTGEYLMDGLAVVLRLITALAIYAVLVYKLDSIKKINWLVFAIIAAQIQPTVEGLVRVAQGGGMALGASEIVRSGHSGQGAFLAMILAFCLVQFLDANTARLRLLWGSLLGFFAVGLFFSYGRAGWIGFGVTTLAIGLLKRSKLLIVFPVVAVLLILLVPTVAQRFADIDLQHLDDSRYSSHTLAGRIQMWRVSTEAWASSPWLGVGYGAGRHEVDEQAGRLASKLHNDYLAVLVGTGLVGLTVFLLWHGQWFVELLRARRLARYSYDKTLTLAVFAMYFASLIVGITDNVLESTEKLYPLVALIAAAFALGRIRAEEDVEFSTVGLSERGPGDRGSRSPRLRNPDPGHTPVKGLRRGWPAGHATRASLAVGVDRSRQGSGARTGRGVDGRPETRQPGQRPAPSSTIADGEAQP